MCRREMQMLTFVHMFENCSQESPAVLANFDDVFKCLKNVKPDVRNVYLKQDNAGCYHSATTMLLVQKVASKHSITLKRIDFSDPQGGKGSCDRKAALIKNHMKFYLNAGNDIETAEQMKSAIESSGCIPGVHVSLCDPQSTSDLKVKWDGVSLINNVEYKDKEIKVWRAYGIGPGKSLSLSKFDLAKTLPKLNKTSEHIAQFVPIKAKRSKITEKSKKTDNVLNSDHYDNSDDEDNDSDKDDDDGEDDDDDIHDHDDLEKGRGEKLYFCPHEGCIKSFQRHNSLENHLDCERHMYAIEHETLYDKAMKSYATKLEQGSSKLVETDQENVNVPLGENLQSTLPMGWVLKSTTKKRRFSDEQKKYLLEIFQKGEQTGKKADPASASKMIRTARNTDGTRKFKKEDFLSSRQIAGFFSRTAAKKKIDVNFDDNDDIQLQQELFDAAVQEMKRNVIDEMAVQQPILFENFDICKMSSKSKLSKLSVSMLQDICSSLQLDT